MRNQFSLVSPVTGAAALLLFSVPLYTAAAFRADSSAPAPPFRAAAAKPAVSPAFFGTRRTPVLEPGRALRAAQARLERAGRGPAAEVDRWAVGLASERETSRAALARFGTYRPLIEDALRRHGLPLDLAFVPWVESEWRSGATSRAGAAGVWQLMAPTARGYGLEVSEYVDERRDPVRATEAAVRHLADLHRSTGDWHWTLAAYNAGLGRARAGRASFWRERWRLPRETRAYVPRVLAAARVGREPGAWGIQAPPAVPLRFREVWTPGDTPLDHVAVRIGAPPAKLRELNPHLVRGRTPPGRAWRVRIPAGPLPGPAAGSGGRR